QGSPGAARARSVGGGAGRLLRPPLPGGAPPGGDRAAGRLGSGSVPEAARLGAVVRLDHRQRAELRHPARPADGARAAAGRAAEDRHRGPGGRLLLGHDPHRLPGRAARAPARAARAGAGGAGDHRARGAGRADRQGGGRDRARDHRARRLRAGVPARDRARDRAGGARAALAVAVARLPRPRAGDGVQRRAGRVPARLGWGADRRPGGARSGPGAGAVPLAEVARAGWEGPMISTGELRKGVIIEVDGQLFNILDYQHLKLGRGSAQVRMKLRDVRSGAVVEKTVQAGSKFPRVRLDTQTVQFLYAEGDLFHFMNVETYDQFALNREQLGDAVNYLKEGLQLEVQFYQDEPIGVELPITVDLRVTHTEPGFKGDTATGGTKPATLETGLTVQVPPFVNVGDVIRVDTRDGSYITRV